MPVLVTGRTQLWHNAHALLLTGACEALIPLANLSKEVAIALAPGSRLGLEPAVTHYW
jgi:hypothetical protein